MSRGRKPNLLAAEIEQMWREGVKGAEITRRLGVTYATAYYHKPRDLVAKVNVRAFSGCNGYHLGDMSRMLSHLTDEEVLALRARYRGDDTMAEVVARIVKDSLESERERK